MTAPYRPVVCGVDGSDASLEAASYAAREAMVRRLPLRIVHASSWLRPHPGVPDSRPTEIEAALRRQVDDILTHAADTAKAVGPELTIATEIMPGSPAATLAEMSRSAALLVLGSRGLGAAASLAAGSVSIQVAGHAYCPVIVVRHLPRLAAPDLPPQPVVVGVDGPLSEPAVDFAFQAAALHGVSVVAMHAWSGFFDTGPGTAVPLVEDFEAAHEREVRWLAGTVAGPSQRHPGVKVEQRVVEGVARHALVEASSHASLLVVGTRGQGGFLGLLLGSVSHAMLHHAHCPVAIVGSRL